MTFKINKMRKKKGLNWGVLGIIAAICLIIIGNIIFTKPVEQEITCWNESGDFWLDGLELRTIENLTGFDILSSDYDYNSVYTDGLCEELKNKIIKRGGLTINGGCELIIEHSYFYSDPDLICEYSIRCPVGNLTYSEGGGKVTFSDVRYGENMFFDRDLVYYDEVTQTLHNGNENFEVLIEYTTSNEVCR